MHYAEAESDDTKNPPYEAKRIGQAAQSAGKTAGQSGFWVGGGLTGFLK